MVLVLLVAACGGSATTGVAANDDSTPSASDGETEAASAPSTGAEDDDRSEVDNEGDGGADDQEGDSEGSTSKDDQSFESPVAELFGLPISDPDALDDQIGQLQIDAERRIAECMREQGFEYTPVDYSAFDAVDDAFLLDEESFAEEFGFGIATSLDGAFEELSKDFVDPNQAYLESLSEGEQDAYYFALYGGGLSFDSFDEEDEGGFLEPEGCSGEAYEEAFSFFEGFELFGEQLEALEESIDSDPRIVEADADWASCMFEAGYGYSDSDEARNDIQRRYDAIVRDAMPDFGALPASPDDVEQGETIIVDGGLDFPPEIQAEVDALAEEEIAVAVASYRCDEPARELYDTVRIEYELRFVEEFGDEVRSALGTG